MPAVTVKQSLTAGEQQPDVAKLSIDTAAACRPSIVPRIAMR